MAKGLIGASVVTVVLLAMWSYVAVDAFLQWEERAGGTGAPAGRAYLDTANDFALYLAGNHSLQGYEDARWEGEYDRLSDSRLTLAGLAILVPVLFFFATKGLGTTFSIACTAGVSLFCGLAHLLVLAGQLVGRALAIVESGSLTYDYSVYSFLLYCTVLAVPAVVCTYSSGGLIRGELRAWKSSLWSSVALIALNAPLLPIWTVQGFAVKGFVGIFLLICLAAINLLVLGMTTANFRFDTND
ncbi:MAG: hypothetical protein IIC73_00045 [Armatimonadetes bacterium]|nr:hypothetical protein [Armatimonadota bacterium]